MSEKFTFHFNNCEPFKLSSVPIYQIDDWRELTIHAVKEGWRITAFFACPIHPEHTAHVGGLVRFSTTKYRLFAVLALDKMSKLTALATDITDHYKSLTPETLQAYWFERELHELWSINIEGHPRLKPIRNPLSEAPFFQVKENEAHEVAVGPVHAATIEPGHFRFQCYGEEIFHLEIALGYQHRGIEHALINGPNKHTIHYLETASGDTTVGHAMAYYQAMEALLSIQVSRRANRIRAIGLELERLANHVGDLGALSLDIGYLPTASYCGKLRADLLNLTAELCGSRLGRGFLRLGGVAYDISTNHIDGLQQRLKVIFSNASEAIQLLWSRPSVLNRFEGVGVLTEKMALDLGLVGLVTRASGVSRDVRYHFPTGIYNTDKIMLSTRPAGDVLARALVRWLETKKSFHFIHQQLESLKTELMESALNVSFHKIPEKMMVVSLVEGWRGEICHVVMTNEIGKFQTYKIVDPSFHNWVGLEFAVRNQQISDFPICNKSFNLSYCGHDL